MHHAPQTGFYASQHYRHIGVQLSQDFGVDDCRIFGAHVMASVRTIGILASESSCSRVFVYHGVHTSWCYTKEQPRSAQAFEIPIVSVPVGLRYDSHTQTFRFHDTSDDGSAKGRMVHIGICAEENDVSVIPSAQFHFPTRGGHPVGEIIG